MARMTAWNADATDNVRMPSYVMGPRQWGLLVVLALLWGCSFLFIELALRDIPVFTVAMGRTGIAALFLVLLAVAAGESLAPIRHAWKGFLLLGALRGAVPISLIVWAQTRIDSGAAAILNATSPLFTMLIAHVLTIDDRLSAYKLGGCAIGMAGVAVMIGTGAGPQPVVLGHLAMLAAACSYGFAAVYGRRFAEVPPTISAAGMLTAATLLALPPALLVDKPWTLSPSLVSTAALLGLALPSTAVAFVVWFKLIRSAGPSNTSLVTFLIPPAALGMGVLVLDEQPSEPALLGLAIILCGVALSQHRR